MSQKPKIVFFGSGPVAAASLRALVDNFAIEAVITKPATREEMSSITSSPLFCANAEKAVDELMAEQKFKSRVAVLVDFGIIVSRSAINYFPLGIVNSHFSLLPQWRGADPISFAILSGQQTTGVCLMLLNEGLDEGELLAKKEVKIEPKTTTPELTETLIDTSNQLLNKYLPKYLKGEIKSYSQDLTKPASYSRKLTKQDGVIDWTKPAKQIEREIRAYAGWPKSRTRLGKIEVIIHAANTVKDQVGRAGEVEIRRNQLIVSCGQDRLQIETLQPAGKKPMPTDAFLAGYKDQILS